MLDFTFFFLLLYPAPEIKIIKEMGSSLSQIMEQVEVEVACAGLF